MRQKELKCNFSWKHEIDKGHRNTFTYTRVNAVKNLKCLPVCACVCVCVRMCSFHIFSHIILLFFLLFSFLFHFSHPYFILLFSPLLLLSSPLLSLFLFLSSPLLFSLLLHALISVLSFVYLVQTFFYLTCEEEQEGLRVDIY